MWLFPMVYRLEDVVNDVALSDNYCVLFKVCSSADCNRSKTELIRKRHIDKNTQAFLTNTKRFEPITQRIDFNISLLVYKAVMILEPKTFKINL